MLTTSGTVPDQSAKALGESDGAQLAERVTTLTNSNASTLAVTAIGRSPEDAVKVADTFAGQLTAYVTGADQARYQKATDNAQKQLDGIQAKLDALNAQIAAVPPPAEPRAAPVAAEGPPDPVRERVDRISSRSRRSRSR